MGLLVLFAFITASQDFHYLLHEEHGQQEVCHSKTHQHFHEGRDDFHCLLSALKNEKLLLLESQPAVNLPNGLVFKIEERSNAIKTAFNKVHFFLRGPPATTTC